MRNFLISQKKKKERNWIHDMIIFLQWLSCVSALIRTTLKYVNELEANQIY